MGRLGWLWFVEKDIVIIEEIAKLHNVSKEVVERHYKEMLEGIRHEVENED